MLDTRSVLAVVDVRLHPSIRVILEDRLLHLEELDRRLSTCSGSGFEPLTEPGESEMVRWLRSQLREAFPPNSGRQLPAVRTNRRPRSISVRVLATQPTTATKSPTVFPDRPLGGHELARLLKRRLIWRTLELLPNAAVTALLIVPGARGDLRELLTKSRALRRAENEPRRSVAGLLDKATLG
jgi:hypothetical protein